VAVHDGFTLRDLVSYDRKHNEANGEENRDGTDANYGANHGVEGPSADPAVRELRNRQARNLLCTLLLSQGAPMLLAGDEFGRTQNGNNNAYCQDNELSWVDWSGQDPDAAALTAFVTRLLELRRDHIVFRRARFFHGRFVPGTTVKDILWLDPDGTETDWNRTTDGNLLYLLISGEAGEYHRTTQGEAQPDRSFLLVLNGSDAGVRVTAPPAEYGEQWEVILDTSRTEGPDPGPVLEAGRVLDVESKTFVLLGRSTP
jgi:glycogen operon protein